MQIFQRLQRLASTTGWVLSRLDPAVPKGVHRFAGVQFPPRAAWGDLDRHHPVAPPAVTSFGIRSVSLRKSAMRVGYADEDEYDITPPGESE